MSERLVTLLRYEDPDQALYFQERLESEGIRVVITDERLGEGEPDQALPGSGGNVLLQVPETQAKEAADILEQAVDNELFG